MSATDVEYDYVPQDIPMEAYEQVAPPVCLSPTPALPDVAQHTGVSAPVSLADFWDEELPAVEPVRLAVEGGMPLLYQGESHLIFGPGGSGKSWLYQHMVAEQAKAGQRSLILDYESNMRTVLERLRALGVTKEQAAHIWYWRITAPIKGKNAAALHEAVATIQPSLVVLDGVAKSMTAAGYNENDNSDCHRWDAEVVIPLVMLGITVALIDHVTKPRQDTASGAALYARGGGAKIDAVSGAAYAFETIESWTRESNGSARLTCAKDREGHRKKGEVAAIIHVTVEDGGRHITFDLRAPSDADTNPSGRGEWKPTFYMEKVSSWLGRTDEPMSMTRVVDGVGGQEKRIRQAVELLISDGYVTEEAGPRNARLFRSVRPYHMVDDEAF